MDSINVDKIQAFRRYKQQQFVNNLLFYPLAALTFGIFCTSPFWFPSLYSSTKTLVCVSIPRILSFFLSAKSLFILGNLIVIFLLRDSKVRPSDPSHNDDDGDNLVKPISPKNGSKKAMIHIVSSEKSEVVQASKPLYHQNNNIRDPMKPTLPSIETEKLKMHRVFPEASKTAVSEGLSERIPIDPYSIGKVDRVRCVEEKRTQRSLSYVEDPAGELEAAKEALWEVEARIEKKWEQEIKVVQEKARNLKKERENLMVPALATDELKRRADDFIAMVNKQIRLEAEDVLLDAS